MTSFSKGIKQNYLVETGLKTRPILFRRTITEKKKNNIL